MQPDCRGVRAAAVRAAPAQGGPWPPPASTGHARPHPELPVQPSQQAEPPALQEEPTPAAAPAAPPPPPPLSGSLSRPLQPAAPPAPPSACHPAPRPSPPTALADCGPPAPPVIAAKAFTRPTRPSSTRTTCRSPPPPQCAPIDLRPPATTEAHGASAAAATRQGAPARSTSSAAPAGGAQPHALNTTAAFTTQPGAPQKLLPCSASFVPVTLVPPAATAGEAAANASGCESQQPAWRVELACLDASRILRKNLSLEQRTKRSFGSAILPYSGHDVEKIATRGCARKRTLPRLQSSAAVPYALAPTSSPLANRNIRCSGPPRRCGPRCVSRNRPASGRRGGGGGGGARRGCSAAAPGRPHGAKHLPSRRARSRSASPDPATRSSRTCASVDDALRGTLFDVVPEPDDIPACKNALVGARSGEAPEAQLDGPAASMARVGAASALPKCLGALEFRESFAIQVQVATVRPPSALSAGTFSHAPALGATRSYHSLRLGPENHLQQFGFVGFGRYGNMNSRGLCWSPSQCQLGRPPAVD